VIWLQIRNYNSVRRLRQHRAVYLRTVRLQSIWRTLVLSYPAFDIKLLNLKRAHCGLILGSFNSFKFLVLFLVLQANYFAKIRSMGIFSIVGTNMTQCSWTRVGNRVWSCHAIG